MHQRSKGMKTSDWQRVEKQTTFIAGNDSIGVLSATANRRSLNE